MRGETVDIRGDNCVRELTDESVMLKFVVPRIDGSPRKQGLWVRIPSIPKPILRRTRTVEELREVCP